MAKIYDTIIIGGGPAGLSAGLYAARSKMSTLIIEQGKFGGQIATTDEVENYPGSEKDATGPSIVARMKEQCDHFDVEFVKETVNDIELEGKVKKLICDKNTYEAKTIIIATGAYPRLSGFENEVELRGKGVSYCATCDADFFTDLDVAVIGGGDSAITEAIYLTKFCNSITVIHRRDQLRAAKSLQEKAFKNPKIKFIWNSVPEKAIGDEILEGLVLKNKLTNETSEVKFDGCFVFVGYIPITKLFEGKINLNEEKYVITDEDMKTNVPGVFAAGDVRVKSLRQVITAAADGAIAATTAERYIESLE